MQWKMVADAFEKVFHAKGLIESPEASSATFDKAKVGKVPILIKSGMRFVGP